MQQLRGKIVLYLRIEFYLIQTIIKQAMARVGGTLSVSFWKLNHWTYILLSDEPLWKKTIYCLVLYKILRATIETGKTLVVIKEKRESNGELAKHAEFLGHGIIMYDAIMVDICQHIL